MADPNEAKKEEDASPKEGYTEPVDDDVPAHPNPAETESDEADAAAAGMTEFKASPAKEEGFRVVDANELEVVESPKEKEARKKAEAPATRPKSQMTTLLIFFAVIFVMIDPNLREGIGNAVGVVLFPVIGFGGAYPVLTIILAGGIMIALSTIVRHFFIDWLKMAKAQNTMRAYQKEFNKARRDRDQKRMNEMSKAQPELMKVQTELSGSQMKPMAVTMLVVIPMFAWLWQFVSSLDYHYFAAPWNLRIDMFTTEGILFGTSVLPHWILLYSVMSIPFGQLLQKALKVWSWRKRVDHVFSDHPDVHEPTE